MSQPRLFTLGPDYSYSKGELTLLAYLAFKRPAEERYKRMVPKDPEAWLEFQVQLVKRKKHFQYISEKDIRNTIRVSKPNIGKKKKPKPEPDPDLPDCHFWGEDEVGDWLVSVGYSHLKGMFKKNCISGRKLVTVDATALNKMGLKYFSEIKDVAVKIRDLLGVHSPNMMRAIMRRPPLNEFLAKKQFSGDTVNFFTFKKFCEANGFPYDALEYNPCALIDSCCQVLIEEARAKIMSASPPPSQSTYMFGITEASRKKAGVVGSSSESDRTLDSDNSLKSVPTVEFTVRHMIVRNNVIKDIIDELLDCVATEPHLRKYGPDAIASRQRLREILDSGFNELGLSDDELWNKMEFAKHVADGLMDEVRKTHKVLQNIQEFKKTLNDKSVTDKEIEHMRDVATDFFDAIATIGALLAFGEFELENIFRQEPEFEEFVDGIIDEAELVLNERVSSADPFVRDVIAESKARISTIELNIPSHELQVVKAYAEKLVDKMIGMALSCVDGLLTRSQLDLSDDFMTPEELAYFKRDSESSDTFIPGSKSLKDMQTTSTSRNSKSRDKREFGSRSIVDKLASSSPAGGDTTETEAEDWKRNQSGPPTTSEVATMSSAGEGNFKPISSGSNESRIRHGKKKMLSRRPSGSHGGSEDGVRRGEKKVLSRRTSKSGGSGEGQANVERNDDRLRRGDKTEFQRRTSGSGGSGQGKANVDGSDDTTRRGEQRVISRRTSRTGGSGEVQANVDNNVFTRRRPSEQDFENAGLHRADFVEKWARDTDSTPGTSEDGKKGSESEHARLVRITADQVVSNILERALTHLLLDADESGSGPKSQRILEALEKLKIDSQEALRANRSTNPYNIDNEILRLWTPTVLSRTLDDINFGQKDGASEIRVPAPPGYRDPYIPPQGTQSRVQIEDQNQKKKGRKGNKECEDDPCEVVDVVCSYPIRIQARRK